MQVEFYTSVGSFRPGQIYQIPDSGYSPYIDDYITKGLARRVPSKEEQALSLMKEMGCGIRPTSKTPEKFIRLAKSLGISVRKN